MEAGPTYMAGDAAVLWDVSSGRQIRSFGEEKAGPYRAVFSPDGSQVLTVSSKAIILWDSATGRRLRTIEEGLLRFWSMAISPDGQQLLVGDGEGKAILRDLSSGGQVRVFEGHTVGSPPHLVESVAFSPDGRLLASGGDDSCIRLWRFQDGTLVKTLTAGTDHVYSVAFSSDGQWLASGGRGQGSLATLWKQIVGYRLSAKGNTVRLWRVSDGALQEVLSEHSDDVWSVAFSPDGTLLVTGSNNHNAKVWNAQTGILTHNLQHNSSVCVVAFSPNDMRVAIGTSHGTIYVWNPQNGALLQMLRWRSWKARVLRH